MSRLRQVQPIDILRESICIDGIQFNLIDTAGIRQSDDVIEQEGIRRAWQAVATADLAFVTCVTAPVCKEAPLWESVLAQKGEQQAMITLANKVTFASSHTRGL